MDSLLMVVGVAIIFLLYKALGRLMSCGFNIKLFMSEGVYAWIGFFILFALAIVVLSLFGTGIKAMVHATL